jgi:hypothetical protein
MRNVPSNTDNVIDSRDIIERIEELDGEKTALVEAIEEAKETLADALDPTSVFANDDDTLTGLRADLEFAQTALDEWETENDDELSTLRAFAEEGESESSEWTHGETLIADSYFEEYAEQLAEDIGAIPRDLSWPCNHIDWEAAADALKQDYTYINFGDEMYWIRNN